MALDESQEAAKSDMSSTTRSDAAFARYRCACQPDQAMSPLADRYGGDTDQMGADDGMLHWVDGPVENQNPEPANPPVLTQQNEGQRLWVVTTDSVLHAPEVCAFGADRQAQVVKHSNLTGGGNAFAGGELIFLDEATVVINGRSRRYRPRDAAEMAAIEKSFS